MESCATVKTLRLNALLKQEVLREDALRKSLTDTLFFYCATVLNWVAGSGTDNVCLKVQ